MDDPDLVAGVQPHIERDLVVAASSGVKPLAGVADFFCQQLLDAHMNVLVLGRKRDLSRVHFLEQLVESAMDRVFVLF